MNTVAATGDRWPALSGPDFAPTRHLLHMMLQVMGKLKLSGPFKAQWSEVPLWLNARGLSTGPIACTQGVYEVRADFIAQRMQWFTSSGAAGELPLGPGSVSAFAQGLLAGLHGAGVDAAIKQMPQEVPDPIPFNEDRQARPFDHDQVRAWWRIMLRIQCAMQTFQGRFTGRTQPIGLMWGTNDLRLVLYSGRPAQPPANAGYIRRNAMTAELIEIGWWPGDASHPEPAFFAYTWPQPAGIETQPVAPAAAGWNTAMGEFMLDYAALRASADPDAALLSFLESTYAAGARAAHWDPALLGSGRPA